MSASDAAARLERAEDVVRVEHPTDKRSAVVRLTPAGSGRAHTALELLDELAVQIAGGAGTTPAELVRLAARLEEVLSAKVPAPE
jgi:DNA-binding MarR family transcriptional regulator